MKANKINEVTLKRKALRIGKVFAYGIVLLTTYYLLPTASAARLYFHPQGINVDAGDSYVVEVRIDTEEERINALDITGFVENGVIESVSTANSLVQIFIESSATGENTFRFAGGTPGGFTGDGIIGRLNIRAQSAGRTSVTFDETADILTGTGEVADTSITYLQSSAAVAEPNPNRIMLTSRSHPDQNAWYNKTDLHLRWELEDGVDYSYLVSLDPSAKPDDAPDRPTGELEWQGDINIEGLGDSVYYFTVKRVGENDISRFRAMIDTEPPTYSAVEVSKGVPETGGLPFIVFAAQDKTSGVDHYTVQVDDGEAGIAKAPYILPADYGKITIRAVDKAGNETVRVIRSETERSLVALYVAVAIILLGGAIAAIRPLRERIFTPET